MYEIIGTTIKLIRGDSFISEVTIYDSDGSTYTPELGDVITFAMKRSHYDAEAEVTKTIPNDTMILQLDPADTEDLSLGRYVYDIDIVMDGVKDTFISGVFILLPEV